MELDRARVLHTPGMTAETGEVGLGDMIRETGLYGDLDFEILLMRLENLVLSR